MLKCIMPGLVPGMFVSGRSAGAGITIVVQVRRCSSAPHRDGRGHFAEPEANYQVRMVQTTASGTTVTPR